jgi:hypothetical protein
MSPIRDTASEMLGVVATHAEEGSDGYTSLRAYCTNAGVGWAAGAGYGRSVAIVTEPYTRGDMGDQGEKNYVAPECGTDDTRLTCAVQRPRGE